MQNIKELFDLSHTEAGKLLAAMAPWEVLACLGAFLSSPSDGYREWAPGVYIGRDVTIAPGATVLPPCVIGEGSEIRPGAFLRGAVLVGRGCVIGNSSEAKNAILFDGVLLPHFNYAGDSILGCGVHLGAGAVVSNLRCDKKTVRIREDPPVDTGRRKFGALIGDGSEIGCNAVINPGTVLGRGCTVYPLSSVSGVFPAGTRVRGGR